ncbi:MAG: hypothetical protein CVU59_01470 [Deltaproteobacteria bacterium HGW-Deltaproteobacteria-17]|nr:MAG: hypothetical protein CVU59_01470 [Deltaproteobacteria bacterium HGW-Deltaproteobacteria-17]
MDTLGPDALQRLFELAFDVVLEESEFDVLARQSITTDDLVPDLRYRPDEQLLDGGQAEPPLEHPADGRDLLGSSQPHRILGHAAAHTSCLIYKVVV